MTQRQVSNLAKTQTKRLQKKSVELLLNQKMTNMRILRYILVNSENKPVLDRISKALYKRADEGDFRARKLLEGISHDILIHQKDWNLVKEFIDFEKEKALGGDRNAKQFLFSLADKHNSNKISRVESLRILADLAVNERWDFLKTFLEGANDSSVQIQYHSVTGLRNLANKGVGEVLPGFILALNSSDESVKIHASSGIVLLSQKKPRITYNSFIRCSKDDYYKVRESAVYGFSMLASKGVSGAIPRLVKMLGDPSEEVRIIAEVEIIGLINQGTDAKKYLQMYSNFPNKELRRQIKMVLKKIGEKKA